ncbi:S8 family serine peptidase [Kitasatospora sp. MAP5-34]|uniref:S8 family serine peptidase n=1 Tax=Kitasatospora sp. MAP5-34 TaxID=3035102 RepID=UPI00247600B8|nr:S8 family serine peptidase [Kitasatospora sp. MAP5-34]MDH6577839.1 subtilisin family serine protease [Kitasatospora sp. MAP5-34]
MSRAEHPRAAGYCAVSPALHARTPREVREKVVQVLPDSRSPVLVELDLTRDPSTDQTRLDFADVFDRTFPTDSRPPTGPRPIAAGYVSCVLGPEEIQQLVAEDRGADGKGPRTVFRVWPDYTLHAHIDRSVSTIKSDAVLRAYAATGEGVVWGVLDSGVDAKHPHFADGTLTGPVERLHRDFTDLVVPAPDPPRDLPLEDPAGHGTHVAGIIAGRLSEKYEPVIGSVETVADDLPSWTSRQLTTGRSLAGMAPLTRLVSLRVLAERGGELITSSSAVIEALYYVRETLNTGGRLLLVHGVNLSFGCPWDPRDYACGQSPLCREVNLLAASGVVVVVSAGNDGFGGAAAPGEGGSDTRAVLATITDPGNADGAITVGSTHRDRPHEFGVTYSSSKGPTLDGRPKPDLLAPGEHITSCATGGLRDQLVSLLPEGVDPAGLPTYVEESGTSTAAPHVSGAIAAFLSARQEFIGRPREVKEIFCANATSLGRDHFLEGHGLVDLMRVMSNV